MLGLGLGPRALDFYVGFLDVYRVRRGREVVFSATEGTLFLDLLVIQTI